MLKMLKEVNKSKMFKFIYISILIIISFLPTISAIDFGYDYLEHTTTSSSNLTLNATQFNEGGGITSIDTTWLSAFIGAASGLWETVGAFTQLITTKPVLLVDDIVLNTTSTAIRNNDNTTRSYFDGNGTWWVEVS